MTHYFDFNPSALKTCVLQAANNALSVRNVRMHGMSSLKWTTRDKYVQYKGLVNLYNKDRVINQADLNQAGKKQYKKLIELRKTIEKERLELGKAISGDKQTIRNILSEKKDMRLAYQNGNAKNVTESISQLNFNKRKEIDRLHYNILRKSQELVDLKLEESVFSDRLKYGVFHKLPDEKLGENITGKVQDAILKKEAALAINQSYAQIIHVMKKDALYFDGILQTIQCDYILQYTCIMNAGKQATVANQYKREREIEFIELEQSALNDMKKQKAYLSKIRSRVEATSSNLKNLLRKDSDVTLCRIDMPDEPGMSEMLKDLNKIEITLQVLAGTTLVTSFDEIFPSLKEQEKQHVRLEKISKKTEKNHDIIMNKLDHAELMRNLLKNTMVETTTHYKQRKRELLFLIEKENMRKKVASGSVGKKNLEIANIRMPLRQIHQLMKILEKHEVHNEKNPPQPQEADGLKIIETLIPLVTSLKAEKLPQLEVNVECEAHRMYETMMIDRGFPIEDDIINDEGVLGEYISEATNILTREEVKRQAKELVDHMKAVILYL